MSGQRTIDPRGRDRGGVSDGILTKPLFAALTDSDGYYSASLKLLSNIAVREAPLAKRT